MKSEQVESIVKITNALLRPLSDTSYPYEVSADHSGVVYIHLVSGGLCYDGKIGLDLLDGILRGMDARDSGKAARKILGKLAASAVVEGGASEDGRRSEKEILRSAKTDVHNLRIIKQMALILQERVEKYSWKHRDCSHKAEQVSEHLASFMESLDRQIDYAENAVAKIEEENSSDGNDSGTI